MATKTQDASSTGWTEDERAAMKEHAAELKRATGKGAAKAAEEAQACLDKIAEMPDDDRALAERVHALITATAPQLTVKTYYGMPGWANEDDKMVCFFQPATKFNVRYSTFGFDTVAALDDGDMWPTSFALLKLSDADERTLAALVRKAVS